MRPERTAPCVTGLETGLAWSLLAEVGDLLDTLAQSGETGAIDLRSLPMTASDREQLQQWLGRGEVQVQLELAGLSEIWETAYPGAWWVRHRGTGGEITTEHIAVCRIPDILLSQDDDIRAAARRLRRQLEAAADQADGDAPTTESRHV